MAMIDSSKEPVYFLHPKGGPDAVDFGLSNYSNHSVTIPRDLGHFPWATEDLEFPTAEAAFHAFKSPKRQDYVRQLMATKDAKDAKALGKKVKLREDWENVKVKWMFVVLWHKFESRKELLDKTELRPLIRNKKCDHFWCNGNNGKGLNKFGKLLMIVREFLNKNEKPPPDFDPNAYMKEHPGL